SFDLIFFFQAEDGIRDFHVTGVQTCALPISIVAACPRYETRSPPPSSPGRVAAICGARRRSAAYKASSGPLRTLGSSAICAPIRSEERRVGKECRARALACPDDSTEERAERR